MMKVENGGWLGGSKKLAWMPSTATAMSSITSGARRLQSTVRQTERKRRVFTGRGPANGLIQISPSANPLNARAMSQSTNTAACCRNLTLIPCNLSLAFPHRIIMDDDPTLRKSSSKLTRKSSPKMTTQSLYAFTFVHTTDLTSGARKGDGNVRQNVEASGSRWRHLLRGVNVTRKRRDRRHQTRDRPPGGAPRFRLLRVLPW